MSDRRIDGMTADDGLLANLRAGTTGAYEVLVDRYHPRLCAYLYRMLGDRSAAEDVAQETFLAVFTSLHTLGDDRSFDAWLFTIAHHKATPHLRRRAILQFVPLDQVVSRVGSWFGRETSDPIEGFPTRSSVQTTLDRMTPREREALLLHSWAGLKSREIAGILGVSPAAAAQRVTRARQRFIDLYGDGNQSADDAPRQGGGRR